MKGDGDDSGDGAGWWMVVTLVLKWDFFFLSFFLAKNGFAGSPFRTVVLRNDLGIASRN